ncbi:virulence factor [Alphaproteobacteria bacterium LSUCC0684]
MASITVIYWRDIPAQVVAEEGRGRNRQQAKVEMPRRFALAIDEAAMRDGADSTDDYLAEWRKAEPEPCEGDLDVAAKARAAELDRQYDQKMLAELVANGGKADA